jgi:hypothetical protein
MLEANRAILGREFPDILERLDRRDAADVTVRSEPSKSGEPTLALLREGRTVYLHSQYNPRVEAERLMDDQAALSGKKRVLFFGVGLGYHLERYLQQHPDARVAVYEPYPEILRAWLSRVELPEQVGHLFAGDREEEYERQLGRFVGEQLDEFDVFILPAYERLFPEAVAKFSSILKEQLYSKRQYIRTAQAFSKAWAVNSLLNFQYTVRTPNILQDKGAHFRGKPAIIVAAGPSLNEELEHLRKIKEDGSAYVFAVGSAINTLIAHNIDPDAACTFDPKEHNVDVFRKVIDAGIDRIPLVYGTSVGFSTLQEYPGPLLHMVTSADLITPYLVSGSQPIDKVDDAPSIAIVTFQLLAKLGCNPIILVGQNLALKENDFYAEGIPYREQALEKQQREEQFAVADVYGGQVLTTWWLNAMRLELERRIAAHPNVEVLNTTKGGAAIGGTVFVELERVVRERLTKRVVEPGWHLKEKDPYPWTEVYERMMKLDEDFQRFQKTVRELAGILHEMDRHVHRKDGKSLLKLTHRFTHVFQHYQQNEFYRRLIRPMNQMRNAVIAGKQMNEIANHADLIERCRKIVQVFGPFLYDCMEDCELIKPVFTAMVEWVKKQRPAPSAVPSS